MKAIAVDDEIYMLETLQEAVSASSDIEMVEAFSSCSAALAWKEVFEYKNQSGTKLLWFLHIKI